MEYIEKHHGTPDKFDPNIIHLQYEKGGHVTVNKAEAQEEYERAQERMRQARIDAAKEIGLTVASASPRMAAQHASVVGETGGALGKIGLPRGRVETVRHGGEECAVILMAA